MICIERVTKIVNLRNFVFFSPHFLQLFRKFYLSVKSRGKGRFKFNITLLQSNHTGSMFILAAVDVHRVFYVSRFAFVVLVLKCLVVL